MIADKFNPEGTSFIDVNQTDETISIYGHKYSFGFFKTMAMNREGWIHVDKRGTFRPYGDLIMPIPEVQDGEV